MTMFGASKRLCRLSRTDTSRLDPICVSEEMPCPSASHSAVLYIFDHEYIGEESGSHDVPEPSRLIGSPTFMVEDIAGE